MTRGRATEGRKGIGHWVLDMKPKIGIAMNQCPTHQLGDVLSYLCNIVPEKIIFSISWKYLLVSLGLLCLASWSKSLYTQRG